MSMTGQHPGATMPGTGETAPPLVVVVPDRHPETGRLDQQFEARPPLELVVAGGGVLPDRPPSRVRPAPGPHEAHAGHRRHVDAPEDVGHPLGRPCDAACDHDVELSLTCRPPRLPDALDERADVLSTGRVQVDGHGVAAPGDQVAAIGALSYIFVIGDVKRVEIANVD